MSGHSPLPWRVTIKKNINQPVIWDNSSPDCMVVSGDLDNNDAEFIVEACNNYEAQKIVIDEYIVENKKLKETLEKSYAALVLCRGVMPDCDEDAEAVKALLAIENLLLKEE